MLSTRFVFFIKIKHSPALYLQFQEKGEIFEKSTITKMGERSSILVFNSGWMKFEI
jgi:hypothetical protein